MLPTPVRAPCGTSATSLLAGASGLSEETSRHLPLIIGGTPPPPPGLLQPAPARQGFYFDCGTAGVVGGWQPSLPMGLPYFNTLSWLYTWQDAVVPILASSCLGDDFQLLLTPFTPALALKRFQSMLFGFDGFIRGQRKYITVLYRACACLFHPLEPPFLSVAPTHSFKFLSVAPILNRQLSKTIKGLQ